MQKAPRGFVIGFGFSTEAHDDVPSQNHIREDFSSSSREIQEGLAVVSTVHPGQHLVGATLGRSMEVPAQPGMLGDCVQDVVAEIPRITGHKPDALHSGTGLMDHHQQIGERGGLGPRCRRRATIGPRTKPRQPRPNLRCRGPINRQGGSVDVQIVVDGLPQQRDLKDTLLLKPLAFFNNVVRRTMNFWPAGVGHYAVGAELVAASGDSDVGRSTGKASVVGVESTGKVEQFQAVRGRAQGLGPPGG